MADGDRASSLQTGLLNTRGELITYHQIPSHKRFKESYIEKLAVENRTDRVFPINDQISPPPVTPEPNPEVNKPHS